MALETWNGSVWVTVATGIRPMCSVTGAIRAATSTASARPANRRGLIASLRPGCGVSASSMVRKSSRPRSAVAANPAQYRPLNTDARGAIGGERGAPCLAMPAVAVEGNADVQQLFHNKSFTNAIGNTGPRAGSGSASRV